MMQSDSSPKGVDFNLQPSDGHSIAKLCVSGKARSNFIIKLFEGGYIPSTDEIHVLKGQSSSLKDHLAMLRILMNAGSQNLFPRFIQEEISFELFQNLNAQQVRFFSERKV
jgi:hypothetical protein